MFENVVELQFNAMNEAVFFEDYYVPRIPVVVKGGAKHWPMFRKWSREYIVQKSGEYQCTVVDDSRPAYAQSKTTLKDYFENHRGKSTLTLEKFDGKNIPEFLHDVPFPNYLFSKNDITRFFFYHSIKDAGTLPHSHGDAFNILQEGKKHWIFYDASPSESPNGRSLMLETFREYPPGSHAYDYFEKELTDIDKRVSAVKECIQEAGDIVFIPRQYAHTVLNKSEVMGVVFETKVMTS